MLTESGKIRGQSDTYRINQFILDDPLIFYHVDPEKSADMFPDTSADALAIIIWFKNTEYR